MQQLPFRPNASRKKGFIKHVSSVVFLDHICRLRIMQASRPVPYRSLSRNLTWRRISTSGSSSSINLITLIVSLVVMLAVIVFVVAGHVLWNLNSFVISETQVIVAFAFLGIVFVYDEQFHCVREVTWAEVFVVVRASVVVVVVIVVDARTLLRTW